MRNRRRTWITGGAGLIVCGVLGMLQTNLVGMPGSEIMRVVTDVVFAASMLLFAFGLSREASVVGRQPVGSAAMVVLALWPFAAFVLTRSLNSQVPSEDTAWMIYGYVSLLVPAAAGLVAAAQIARSGNVPAPWRWAPMWVLAAYAVTWAVPEIVFVSVRPDSIQAFADLFLMLGALDSLAGTLGLGILAIILAVRERPGSVEVYRSA